MGKKIPKKVSTKDSFFVGTIGNTLPSDMNDLFLMEARLREGWNREGLLNIMSCTGLKKLYVQQMGSDALLEVMKFERKSGEL